MIIFHLFSKVIAPVLKFEIYSVLRIKTVCYSRDVKGYSGEKAVKTRKNLSNIYLTISQTLLLAAYM